MGPGRGRARLAGVRLSARAGRAAPGAAGAAGAAGARHAIYFVPADDSALGRLGASVLGRWPDGRAAAVAPGAPPCRAARVERPARYGFHATLKAPFELAAGATPEALAEALDRFERERAPVALGELELRHGGGSTVLGCARPSAEVRALADAAVEAFEPFRAPLSAAARARRAPERLDAAARARLERWGYPWVFDGFDFHMTLGAGASSASAAEDAAWLDWVGGAMAACGLAGPERIDRVALCSQPRAELPFARVAECPLRGRVEPGAPLAPVAARPPASPADDDPR